MLFFHFMTFFCEYVIECIKEGVMLIAKNQKGLLVSALENGLNREKLIGALAVKELYC